MHLDNQQDEQCSSYNYSLNIIELIQLLCSNAIIQCREELWKKECNAYIKRWNDNFELHSNSIVFPLKLHIKCTKTKYAQIHPEGNTIRKHAGRQGVTTNTTNMHRPLGSPPSKIHSHSRLFLPPPSGQQTSERIFGKY